MSSSLKASVSPGSVSSGSSSVVSVAQQQQRQAALEKDARHAVHLALKDVHKIVDKQASGLFSCCSSSRRPNPEDAKIRIVDSLVEERHRVVTSPVFIRHRNKLESLFNSAIAAVEREDENIRPEQRLRRWLETMEEKPANGAAEPPADDDEIAGDDSKSDSLDLSSNPSPEKMV